MEKITFLPNGQWKLEKGVMRRLAPKPDPDAAKDVGGGSASQFRPIEDESHKKRARHMLVKDTLKNNPKAIKMIDGVPHIMLHRGLNDKNWHPEEVTDSHVVHAPTRTKPGSGDKEAFGGNAYTTQHNWAEGHGSNVVSIWAPINDVHNYSDYTWKMASQSAHRNEFQDMNGGDVDRLVTGEKTLSEIPLVHDEKNGNYRFHEDVHAYVGPGKFARVSDEELAAAKQYETQNDPAKRTFDLNIKRRKT